MYFGHVGKIFNSVEVCYSEKEINILGSNKSPWIFFSLCVLLSSAYNNTENKGLHCHCHQLSCNILLFKWVRLFLLLKIRVKV